MAVLPTRSFNTIVSSIAAGMQGRMSVFLNFAIGSALRATAEAYAGVCLWLEGVALEIAKLTRLSTSSGSDVDTFIADYFSAVNPSDAPTMQRLGAQAATGLVVFSRFTPSAAALAIPVGSTIQTTDGKTNFLVVADTTNGAFNVALNAYVMPAQVTSVTVPVEAAIPGLAGNIAANSLRKITSSIPGVDDAINPGAFTNGIDQESDDAVRRRFRLAIASLSKATPPAIQFAIQSLRSNMEVTIQNNVDYDGTIDNGMVTVIVDDGSGNLPDDTLAACQNAVNLVRAAGVRVGVYAATVKFADVSMSILTKDGYFHPNIVADVAAALALNINSLGLGNDLSFFDLSTWAREVPGVAKVVAGSVVLNGGTDDLSATPLSTIKARKLIIS